MSDSTFVMVCLAGVFGLIAVVGGLLTSWLFYKAQLKAWTARAALAKANGAAVPAKPRPIVFSLLCIIVVLGALAIAAYLLAPVVMKAAPPPAKPAAAAAPAPKAPETPPAAPAQPSAPASTPATPKSPMP